MNSNINKNKKKWHSKNGSQPNSISSKWYLVKNNGFARYRCCWCCCCIFFSSLGSFAFPSFNNIDNVQWKIVGKIALKTIITINTRELMFTHVPIYCICLLVVIVAVPLLILFTDYSILFPFYTHFYFECVGPVLLLLWASTVLLLLRQITSERAKRLLEINFNVWINNMGIMRE